MKEREKGGYRGGRMKVRMNLQKGQSSKKEKPYPKRLTRTDLLRVQVIYCQVIFRLHLYIHKRVYP